MRTFADMEQMYVWIEDFLQYMQSVRGKLPRTIATYRESLGNAVEFFVMRCGSEIMWDRLKTDDVREYVAEQMSRGYAPAYVKKNMAALRSLYRYLLREGRVKVDPARLVKDPRQQKRLPSFVRESELDRLFDEYDFGDGYLGIRNRTILLTLYHTGMRASELLGLTLGDIDLPGNSLKVTGKGDKQRIIPYGDELHDAISIYIKERAEFARDSDVGDVLFLSARCKPLPYEELLSVVHECLGAVTTQKRRSPHVLRHSFATAMLAHGAQLEAIQHLLGHESVGTTAIYTHTTLAELKEQYANAHPRNEEK